MDSCRDLGPQGRKLSQGTLDMRERTTEEKMREKMVRPGESGTASFLT